MKTLSKYMLVLLLLYGVQGVAQKTNIDQSQLPVNARTFTSDNFGNTDIINVVKESKIHKTEYKVYLSDGSKLEFDDKGNWKEVKSTGRSLSEMAFIPKNIKDYAARNFPTFDIREIEKEKRKYEVKLSNNLELEFDLNGNFLRIDD